MLARTGNQACRRPCLALYRRQTRRYSLEQTRRWPTKTTLELGCCFGPDFSLDHIPARPLSCMRSTRTKHELSQSYNPSLWLSSEANSPVSLFRMHNNALDPVNQFERALTTVLQR